MESSEEFYEVSQISSIGLLACIRNMVIWRLVICIPSHSFSAGSMLRPANSNGCLQEIKGISNP
jgi:hypothetical protein